MILSPATRLRDRQTVWVARRNDDSPFYKLTTDYGVPATTWSAQFAEVHATDRPCPISGWRSTQWG